jgi:hypothetical protein
MEASDWSSDVCSSDLNIFIESGGLDLPIATFPSSLANTGKTLKIINSAGITIDSIAYANAKPACAWERDDEGNFYLSTDSRGGTPGAVNSPKTSPLPPDNSNPGDVVINEVMANPAGLTAFPETEYVEIFNASETAVSLVGWTFVYDNTSVALPDTTLLAGSYAVLYRAGRNIFVESGGLDLPVATFPSSLANTGKTLKIINSAGTTIDSITYATAKPACSWERDDEGNFYLSTDSRGGTPGAVNSPKTTPPPPAEPDNSTPGDVVINEVMANPVGLTALPETEYVELYNASETSISLNNWLFVYDNTSVSLPDTTLLAGSFAVLYRAGRNIFIESGGLNLPIATFPSSLANTGKTLKIINSVGVTIDSIAYATAKPACAWERDDEGNFYLSTDPGGGTPGAVNSPKNHSQRPEQNCPVFERELVFNEILLDPFEGGSEYIELYNRSGQTLFVFDLFIATRKSDGTLNTRYPLSSIADPVPPGGYIVLTNSETGVSDFYITSGEQTIYEMRLPILNNTGSTLVLLSANDETIIDEVSYSSKWHDVFMKNTKGVALERINPDAATQDATNWMSAISLVGYGTPGYQNSQFSQTETPLSLSIPEYISSTKEYRIEYQANQPGYRCHIQVFNLNGGKVADIANNQLMGMSGYIYWDGNGLNGSRLHTGIYIFFAEIYHPNGQYKSVKKPFLVMP